VSESAEGGGCPCGSRNYIWYGGQWPDDHDEHPGEDWCFAYGEREWRGGESFEEIKEAARQGLIDPIDCSTGEVVGNE
jgi:hypothetical protein